MALPEGLLAAAKINLSITWDDADTDTNLTGILERGIVYLNGVAGAAKDYTVEGDARALLFDYAMYARSGALSEFEKSYLSALLALQINTTVNVPPAEAGG